MSFFFTLLDDSLRPVGSRDPLGIEYIWSTVGRHLVGNLTTVTSHLDNFVFALLGFYLCRDTTRAQSEWATFQRFEQLTSRARVAEKPGPVLGSNRIKLSSVLPIVLGNTSDAIILSNQRQAGLWGLYSTALSGAKLIGHDRTPTPIGCQLAERFLNGSPPFPLQIVLNKKQTHIDSATFEKTRLWVKHILSKTTSEKQSLARALLEVESDTVDLKQAIYDQGVAFLHAKQPHKARCFLQWLAKNPSILNDYAERMLSLDNALVLSKTTFDWLLGNHGKDKSKLLAELAQQMKHWPYQSPLVPDFKTEVKSNVWHARASGLEQFCQAMMMSEWETAVDRLLEHHRKIMEGRGGVSWCQWEGDQFKVLMSTTPGTLPSETELAPTEFENWMQANSFGFFLGSFLAILQQSGLAKGAE